jgi:hypothetical protein
MGWSGTQNGALLRMAADDRFDVLPTGDRNLTFQQPLKALPLAVVVMETAGTELRDTMPLMPKVLAILPTLKPGQVVRVCP